MLEEQLKIDVEENLLNSYKNGTKDKLYHKKIQSFEISQGTEFNKFKKNVKIDQRQQSIQVQTNGLQNKISLINSIRKTQKSEIIEENLEQNDINTLIKTKTKNSGNIDLNEDKKNKKVFFLDKIPINVLKVITIIMIILYIIVGITSVVIFAKERNERPFLFCFNFIKRYNTDDMKDKDEEYDIILFLTDLNSFCIIHLILLFILIYILITLFRNQENDVKNFFKDVSIFLDLTIIVNISIFILGIFANYNDNEHWAIFMSHIILTGLGTIFMSIIYIKTKSNKYKNITRLINQGLLSGVLTSFELYCLLYNICYLTTWRTETKDNITMEIVPGTIYFIFGLFSTIYYKDIIFSVTMLILEIGLLYIKRVDALSLVIFNICAVFFNFFSIILTIFNYNKKVFNLVEILDSEKGKKI